MLQGVTSVGGSSGRGSDIRVHAVVNGLGPKFMLRVELQNASTAPLFGVMLFCSCDPKLYSVIGVSGSRQGAGYCIPVLLPGPKHFVELNVLSLDPSGRAGQVTIMMSQSDRTEPMLSAAVRMPASELVDV
jgi:Bardet-Biedl syndrome 1 protein